jgi:hypothetical protein
VLVVRDSKGRFNPSFINMTGSGWLALGCRTRHRAGVHHFTEVKGSPAASSPSARMPRGRRRWDVASAATKPNFGRKSPTRAAAVLLQGWRSVHRHLHRRRLNRCSTEADVSASIFSTRGDRQRRAVRRFGHRGGRAGVQRTAAVTAPRRR